MDANEDAIASLEIGPMSREGFEGSEGSQSDSGMTDRAALGTRFN